MGLGPSTVVRLESALTHEVLRYCTAIRGSVLKVVRGTGWDESTDATRQLIRGAKSPTAFETLIGHNRKPATTTSWVGYTGMRKQPSTQAPSKVREPVGTVKLVWFARRWATQSSENRLWWCAGVSVSGDTPTGIRFCEHEH